MRQIFTCLFLLLSICQLEAQELYFPPVQGNEWTILGYADVGVCEEQTETLFNYLDETNTKAFIILKDGKIVIEKYFDSFTQDSIWPWFSAGKGLTSLLTGIAQEEDYFSIDDPSSDYLGPGWTSLQSNKEELITIKHQLSMTSGMNDNGGFFSCTSPACLRYIADAGERWSYHNSPYTLLRDVIENATGLDYNAYFDMKVKSTTGMTGVWLPLGFNNIYFSKARSMARFGLLMLNQGIWDQDTVLSDRDYFHQMISPSQELNESYGYLWWLNGQQSFMTPQSQTVFPGMIAPNAPEDTYSAIGKDGQIINVVPSQNLVIVRMGEAPNSSLVPAAYMNDMWKHINPIFCTTTSTPETSISNIQLKVYPNPAKQRIFIDLANNRSDYRVEVRNLIGKLKYQGNNLTEIDLSGWEAGIYFLSLYIGKKQIVRKFIRV